MQPPGGSLGGGWRVLHYTGMHWGLCPNRTPGAPRYKPPIDLVIKWARQMARPVLVYGRI